MAGNIDFFLQFVGTAKDDVPTAARVTDPKEIAKLIDLPLYERARADRGPDRTLVVLTGQSAESIDDHRTMIMKLIMDVTDGRVDRIGNFCALGASNSASVILSVAKALADLGAPKLSFLGVVDVTLIPFGRKPSVTGIGTLQPLNSPDVSGIPGGAPWKTRLRRSVNARFVPPPTFRITGTINAAVKRQVYQPDGNWIKVVSESPGTGNADWWWTSDMGNNEVHGEILGWENPKRTAIRQTDDEKHVEIIDAEMPRLAADASRILSTF